MSHAHYVESSALCMAGFIRENFHTLHMRFKLTRACSRVLPSHRDRSPTEPLIGRSGGILSFLASQAFEARLFFGELEILYAQLVIDFWYLPVNAVAHLIEKTVAFGIRGHHERAKPLHPQYPCCLGCAEF